MLTIFLSLLTMLLATTTISHAQNAKQFELNAAKNQINEDDLLPAQLRPQIPKWAQDIGPKETEPIETGIETNERPKATIQLQQEVNHGEIPVGVLGTYTDYYGKILDIYPGSDLIRAGIKPGDTVVSQNGHTFKSIKEYQDDCRGLPGSWMELEVERNGVRRTYQVMRKDARLFTSRDPDGYFKWCVEQIKRW